jgi:hypothetical protein
MGVAAALDHVGLILGSDGHMRLTWELGAIALVTADLPSGPVSPSDLVCLASARPQRRLGGEVSATGATSRWMAYQTHTNVTSVWFVAGALAMLDRLLMVNLDRFEHVNDRHGHLLGLRSGRSWLIITVRSPITWRRDGSPINAMGDQPDVEVVGVDLLGRRHVSEGAGAPRRNDLHVVQTMSPPNRHVAAHRTSQIDRHRLSIRQQRGPDLARPRRHR